MTADPVTSVPDSGEAQPTREELLALCAAGVVPESQWRNRDSANAQRQLGQLRALIAAGCEFYADPPVRGAFFVTVYWKGFNYFEYGHDAAKDDDRFYCPTADRLERAAGGDWY